VGERFFLEAGAGVANAKDHGAGGADGVHFDDLFGIELCTVFHGVHEDLAEGLDDLLFRVFGELGAEFFCEREKALGGDEAAVGADGDPTGACREDFDVVARLVVGGGTGGEGRDLLGIEGRGEAAEDAGSEGGDDLVRSAVLREDDALEAGPDGTHLFEEREVFIDIAVGAGDDDVEAPGTEALEGIGGACRIHCR